MKRSAIATFNTGSSSLKFSLQAIEGDKLGALLYRGAVSNLPGDGDVSLSVGGAGILQHTRKAVLNRKATSRHLISAIAELMDTAFSDFNIIGAGHRIVHGGAQHNHACLVDDMTLASLHKLSIFAPSHQPHNLAGVAALSELWPDRLQSLSFDTAFHRAQPRIAQIYALPRSLTDDGIIRYGFHGLSYAHVAASAGPVFGARPHRKLIAAHLGSGASLCAMKDGMSVATTMGLTALDGLPMSTRCGDLDPGVVIHLIQDRNLSAEDVADMLYTKSGMLGVSGLSADLRDLLASDEPHAKEAIDLYIYRIVREIGSLATALGGLEALVFTGGVGENAPYIRRRVCQDLAWLGVKLDVSANDVGAGLVSAEGSRVSVAVIEADEEQVIARDAFGLFL
jgi:acetate kinase